MVVAEGTEQDLMGVSSERDATDNIRLEDTGIFLKEKIKSCSKQTRLEVNLKHVDSNSTIWSIPANPHDLAFCLILGTVRCTLGWPDGRTRWWGIGGIDLPIFSFSSAVSKRKQIDPKDETWIVVLMPTGQRET